MDIPFQIACKRDMNDPLSEARAMQQIRRPPRQQELMQDQANS